ncbi:HAD-IA family hydrolase [Gordonia sp. NB41Y]|uniref:HAD family hydrolase n=1 Tax=Gordonia sp. NB41Y TaxID=875808 RepID=UPI0006B164FB|nr:HAD-IA family hydrolase [Gordonia sp. NB41Y]EMP11319.2 haloacid dehalogenase [Gordonia sp. NB41Y]WLP91624.1 HAD-IA family hydrolase [Gordonia sp. NB41Y]
MAVETSVPRAVLFDFSGTLFRFEARDEWFAGLHDAQGRPLHVDAQADLIRRMTQPVGMPADLTGDDRIAWEQRDLDPAKHRRAYLAVLRASGLTVPGHAEKLYARILDPHSWVPFPDTAAVLAGLAAQGIAVGVVSNIAFDLREVLALHGLTGHVGAWALSYEVGVIKPDPRIFQAALDGLGVPPEQTLMIGDSEHADGGSRTLGCAFELVADGPVTQRPDALISAVAAHGVTIPAAD